MKLANIRIEGKEFLALSIEDFIVKFEDIGIKSIQNTLEWILLDEKAKKDILYKVSNIDLNELVKIGKALKMIDDRIEFLPAVYQPSKIVCVGHNFRTHILEMKREIPTHPMIFAKYSNVLAGHREVLPLPEVSDCYDFEAELTFVIGKKAKNVKKEEALDYVAGFTIANDLSVRDFQRRTLQFLSGKSFDKSGPIGPVMVTRDELKDVNSERMTLRLNGEIMQETPLSDMVFTVSDLVAQISECMTLEPGDVILSGTPGGVGTARNPPVYIQHGDTIEIDISNIGVLRNSFKKFSLNNKFPSIHEMRNSLKEDKEAYIKLLDSISEKDLHNRPYSDSWMISEVIVHIAEAINFFLEESKKGINNPMEKIGRHKTLERRVNHIAIHADNSAQEIKEQISKNIDEFLEFLIDKTDIDLELIIEHKLAKFGKMKLGSFIDHFVVYHSKSHLKQANNILNRINSQQLG